MKQLLEEIRFGLVLGLATAGGLLLPIAVASTVCAWLL